MKKKTLKALKKSMKHWLDNAGAKKRSDAGVSSQECALCEMFYEQNYNCLGCPVFEHTGLPDCRNTPFEEACGAYNDWLWDDGEAFRKTALEEYEFLKSLLPKGESA